eukprot:s1456_g5.t1
MAVTQFGQMKMSSNVLDACSSAKQIKALTLLLWCSPGTMDATMGSIAPTGLKGKLAALEESFDQFDAQKGHHGRHHGKHRPNRAQGKVGSS